MQNFGGAPNVGAAPQKQQRNQQQHQQQQLLLQQQQQNGIIRNRNNGSSVSSSGDENARESEEEYASPNNKFLGATENSTIFQNSRVNAASTPSTASAGSTSHNLQQQQQQQQHNITNTTITPTNQRNNNIVSPNVVDAASGTDYADVEATSSYVEGTTPMAVYNEERMRRKLQFFFMNPIEKWHARRKFPYKFVVQVIKIVLVTMQLCLFAHSRYNHINYTWDNRIAFSHLFLKGWDATRETESYPPSVGPFALYEKSEFFSTIDFAVRGYANMNRSIGPYDYPTPNNEMAPLKLCLYNYREGTIFGFNESYIFNPEIETLCELLPLNVTKMGVEKYLAAHDIGMSFSSLVKATLVFAIKTVNFKAYGGPLSAPDCFKFDITIFFDNRDHDGQMLLSLDADATRLPCKGDVEFISNAEFDAILRSVLNIFVMTVCMVSFALCTRALYRAYLLRRQTVNFFQIHYRKELSFDGRMEFVNFWYIMILFNDVLLILGSALKEQIERKFLIVDQWDTCSLFLGIGNLLVWFGVLRYLGFFKTYNVVVLTLKQAAPRMLRFLLAALLIYAGFAFCGWLILGPYHMKFRSLATTSECLFSLINGDDMFATFSTLSSKANWLWWFCQIYLYSFISLYIYVVLSLFISVIMDSYDTIKRYYRDGFPISDLREFIGTRTEEDLTSGVFMNNVDDFDDTNLWDTLRKICCCGRCHNRMQSASGPTGYTSLTSIIK